MFFPMPGGGAISHSSYAEHVVEVENGLVLHNWGTFVLTFGANLPVPCHNIETTIQLIPMDH